MIEKSTGVMTHFCQDCIHFYLHYRKSHRNYYPIGWGHCSYPNIRLKYRGEGCHHFQMKEQSNGPSGVGRGVAPAAEVL